MKQPQIKTWSNSRLKVFEKCPYQAKLAFIDKLPQPSSEALDRGNAAHDMLEKYIKGQGTELPVDRNKTYAPMNERYPVLDLWREMYPCDDLEVEEEWGFAEGWEPCDYHADNVWGRVKLDVFFVDHAEREYVILDWKTGRKKGNEVSHGVQGTTYAISAFQRYQKYDKARIVFGYVDANSAYERRTTRAKCELFRGKLEQRIAAMLNETEFRPIPSKWSCKYCPYGAENTGDCGYSYIG